MKIEIKDVVRLIKDEPEYPNPCTKLRQVIHEAVLAQDEEWILHVVRQAVRQTKENIINNLYLET